MYTLITALLFSLAFTYFATQNTATVSIRLANTYLAGVPLYWIIFAALFTGVLVAAIISAIESLSLNNSETYSLKARKNEAAISDTKNEVNKLNERVHELENENRNLQQELEKTQEQSPFYAHNPTFFDRLRSRFSTI